MKKTLSKMLGVGALALGAPSCESNQVSLGYGFGYSPDERIEDIDRRSDTLQLEYSGRDAKHLGFEIGTQLGEAKREHAPVAEIIRKRLFLGGRYTFTGGELANPYLSAGLALVEVTARTPHSNPPFSETVDAIGPYIKAGIDFRLTHEISTGFEINYLKLLDEDIGGRSLKVSELELLWKFLEVNF